MDDFLKKMFIDEAKPALNRHSGNGGTGGGGSPIDNIITPYNYVDLITFDQNIDGKDYVDVTAIAGVEVYYVKVSDNYYSAEQLEEYYFQYRKTLVDMYIDGGMRAAIDNFENGQYGFIGLGSTMEWSVLFVSDASKASAFINSVAGTNLTFPGNGTYFMYSPIPQYNNDELGVLIIGEPYWTGFLPLLDRGMSEIDFCYGMHRIRPYSGNHRLVRATIPDSVTDLEFRAFTGCRELPNINIPESVNYIGPEAFSSCTNLEELIIPCPEFEYLGYKAFFDCIRLKSITFKAATPPKFGTSEEYDDSPFGYCDMLTAIKVPAESIQAYKEALTNSHNWTTGSASNPGTPLSDLVVADDSE